MSNSTLPPGQRVLHDFPRFGLTPFATRIPTQVDDIRLELCGDVHSPQVLTAEFAALERVEQTSDFHCVTTWSYRGLHWSGYRFADFYEQIVVPGVRPQADATFVIFRGLDGYSAGALLQDLLSPDVLLADRLNGAPLSVKHGAPLRLVAPALYGYKNPKHLRSIGFWRDRRIYRPSGLRFMDHPRARVAHEERGIALPGWVYRYLYRPLVGPTIRTFEKAWAKAAQDQAHD